MPAASALTELWLAKGDLAQARSQAENFLNIALATAEHTWQALAWEVNARVEMAEEEWSRAEQCIAKALLTIEGYDVPLAAWRVMGLPPRFTPAAGRTRSPKTPLPNINVNSAVR